MRAKSLLLLPHLFATLILFTFAAPLPAAPSLSAVGDLGKIVDSQGIVSVRPKMAKRWSLATKNFAVEPGDWLRTDVRGANALAFRLSGGGQVILGPGTLVEVIDAKTIAFTRGEIEIATAKKGEIIVQPAQGKSYPVRDGERKVLRRPDGRGVQVLEKDPNWLLGFKGAITSESMGSLLANVDGRNTPLTLGYHKVTVDIRDGIARTVIEESFINHTKSRLEGTFYFPLPQDSSISGFGMWIGGELVEADVVEKQRAREIYETILRERRDPGLLEWTGGNLFKARVFPILPHSEKRIKITYTQVLPMRHGKLRYSYGLQSEMLRQNPLRELSINVRVSSELPIRSFTCGTHDARISTTTHSAQAEFVAQEYTPSRDFEVEIDIDAGATPVVMIPHRRGEDGYFLALVTPPGGDGDWQREVVPDGDPVHLVILADTSGSMDAAARANQDALIAGLLGSLGVEDSFQIATCDTQVRWFNVEKFAGPREEFAELARDFVAARNSLGWTDLDRVFEDVLKNAAKPNTHVVYIGDGVLTTGNADPVEFANRLKRLYGASKGGATFHAVAPGSSFESGVLKAIASLGGGSVRKIGGSDSPGVIAQRLLSGIAQPGLRDAKIDFKGLRVARVYPEELPNLPAGSQQVVIGRYLPEGVDQSGEIIVTGTREGRKVRFSAPLSLQDAETGNSFIPRLWARMHLDVLLEQGRTQEIKDEIIALSEEYKIMTPYTSFLVLESDADRERFKVKKRFQMRDGERFFADGRERANYELLQQQMRLAGTWRLNLRRKYLFDLGGLGRGMMGYQQQLVYAIDAVEHAAGPSLRYSGIGGGGHGYFGDDFGLKANLARPSLAKSRAADGLDMEITEEMFSRFGEADTEGFENGSIDWSDLDGDLDPLGLEDRQDIGERTRELFDGFSDNRPMASEPKGRFSRGQQQARRQKVKGAKELNYLIGWKEEKSMSMSGRGGRVGNGQSSYLWHWRDYMGDLVSLFPPAIADGRHLPDRGGKAQQEDQHPWPAEVIALADSLLRLEQIAALRDGGLAISQNSESFNVLLGSLSSKANIEALISGGAWWVKSSGDRQGGGVQWWQDKSTRGLYFDALGLGRVRAADLDKDRFAFPIELGDHSLASMADGLRQMDAKIVKRDGDRVTLVVTNRQNPKTSYQYIIDTARHVVLKTTNLHDGKVTGTTDFSDFIELAGCWWARSVEHKNAEGKTYTKVRRAFTAQDEDTFAAALKMALQPQEEIVFIHEGLPSVEDAKQAAADGKASFESAFTLCNHLALSQQWERSSEQFEAMRKFEGAKRGMRYLDIRYHSMKRRNEEARELVFASARDLAANQHDHELYLAQHLNTESQRLANQNERFDYLEIVKPIYERAAEHLLAGKDWRQQMVYALQNTNRRPEATVLLLELAEEFSSDVNLQTQYANMLSYQGEVDAALEWLDAVMAKRGDMQAWEVNSLRSNYANLLEGQSRVEDVLKAVTEWLEDADSDESHSSWVRRRYLSALIRSGDDDKAYDLIGRWLSDAIELAGDDFDTAAQNRAWVSVETLCGNAYNVNRNDIPERFHPALAKLARKFALDRDHHRLAVRPMQDHRFHNTETARKLRSHFTTLLAKPGEKLELGEVRRIYNWISRNDPAVDKEVWQGIAGDLIERWSKKKLRVDRDAFAATIVRITSGQLGAGPYLGFLRRQLEESDEKLRGHYANDLFGAILGQPHTAALEEEGFALLYELGTHRPQNVENRRDAIIAEQASALVRLDDWILQSALDVAWAKLEKKEDLSRIELAAKRSELIKSVREALAARLAKEHDAERGESLADWLTIERLYVDVKLKRDPAAIVAECWEYLGNHDVLAPPAEKERPLHEVVLIGRHVATLEFLAARPKADPALAERLLTWFDRGIANAPDADAWKLHKYRLLVALDRPQALKVALNSWIKPGDANNDWRVTLGYLHAELNEIADAVKVFEAVEKADELGPREYKTLADWYTVLDQKQNRERAILGYYQAMEEWQLSNLIQQHTNQIQNGFNNGTPEEFDPAVVDMFKAIFKKSRYPQNHLSNLGSLFRYTKDFRLLECVPEGILGNSAQQIYPFLSNMERVLRFVGDEATTDQILEHLVAVRGRAETPIDQRGLDLLEMQVRRKASEVLNQPGQHVPLALAAMQRAFKLEWGSGERRLMADFLAELGSITQKPLAAEQLRELVALFRAEKKATPDRLHIATRWARVVRNYGGRDMGKAVVILESALDEFVEAHGGILTTDAQGAFDQLIGYLEADRSFARGEKKIFAALERDVNIAVHDWLTVRKYRLYMHAISAKKGRVSLGEGVELYRRVERALIAELQTKRNNHRYLLCNQLIDIYRAAHFNAKIASVKTDIVAFGSGAFDEMITFDTQNYQNLVQQLGHNIHEISGDLPALAFLIGRYEHEPDWFRATGRGGWQRYSYDMAKYRAGAKAIGALEPRLLKIVLAELRLDLETQQSHRRSIYHDNQSYFWSEKRADFQRLAEKVAKERKKSIVALKHIANYLFHGLDAHQSAIDILVNAHERGIQDESGTSMLAGFFENRRRFGEAVPYLHEIVALNATQADYRRRLITALGLSDQRDAAIAALDAAISFFKEHKSWRENTLSPLAKGCYEGKLWERGVVLYDELIPLHQRTQPNRGIGNGTLSKYYANLSACHSHLGDTAMAVEAAAGAIVSWGPAHGNRSNALRALKKVLEDSNDLDAYVAQLDKSVEESGLDNPIVRKALGQVYSKRKEYKKAIRHLRLATESQPGDAETNLALVSAYDALGDGDGAIKQLLESIALSTRNIALFKDLGARYERLGRNADAERARTSIVEALPNESEGHAMLAEIRQAQERWREAAQHWAQVADIRALEPTGLQRLADAQIKLGNRDGATESLEELLAKEWPSRFGDVHSKARKKLVALEKKTSKL